jgi:diaminopimelate epimerase
VIKPKWPIPFSKLSGSGNDFVLIDNRERLIDTSDCVDFVQAICRRRLSVGADGVIFVEPDPKGEVDFAWHYFNSDGSEGEMCGNGGRCVGRFAFEKGIVKTKVMRFRTIAGIIQAQVTGTRTVRLQMTPPFGYKPQVELDAKGSYNHAAYIDTGVPHAVIEVDDAENVNVQTEGRAIRQDAAFSPSGANADFVQITGEQSMLIRTYERGVEAETLACGTGCVAGAITMALAGRVAPPVTLTARSGEKLVVDFKPGENIPSEVFFEGAVSWIYDGELLPESLNPPTAEEDR